MVHYFPQIYPDETLYSIVCRYHIHTGSISWANSYSELFGYKDVRNFPLDFPTKIDELTKRIPHAWGITEDYLINHCTLLPLYSPFMSGDFEEEIKDLMCSRKKGLVLNKMGLRLARDNNIYYCATCSKEDLDTYSETYIRRIHQVPGVLVCPTHGTYLSGIERVAEKQELRYVTHLDIESENSVLDNHQLCEKDRRLLKEIALDIFWLLASPKINVNSTTLLEKYKVLLKSHGYEMHTGKLKSKKLVSEFVEYYGANLLEVLGLPSVYSKSHWLLKLIYANTLNLFPIRHVLFMRFLAGSVEQFVRLDSQRVEEPPFGDGPWYCLNPAAPHHNQRVITNLQVHHRSSDNYSGTFICECGFIYTRRGPFANEEDEFRIGIVRQYGPVWENKLRKLVGERSTLANMRDKLGIGTDALKSAIANLDIDVSRVYSISPIYNSRKKVFSTEKERENHRNKLRDIISSRPELSLREIINEVAHTYMWLQQHDEEWLKELVVNLKKGHGTKNKADDDKVAYEKVSSIVRNWDKEGERPVRRNKKEICQILNLSVRYVSRLPMTNSLIQDNIESKAQYLFRLVDWIITNSREKNEGEIKEEDIYPQIPVKYPQKWLVEYVQKRLGTNSII